MRMVMMKMMMMMIMMMISKRRMVMRMMMKIIMFRRYHGLNYVLQCFTKSCHVKINLSTVQ